MDFNLDDPLGDILSDGSDDSFFGSIPKKKSTPKKSSEVQSGTSKGKMEELFGIKETKQPAKSIFSEESVKVPVPIQEPIVSRKVQETPPKPKPSSSSLKSDSIFNDDDDIILDLGFDPKKPKSTKSSILDDLLGPIETTKKPQLPTTGSIQKDEKKVISRQSTETTESTAPGTYTASLSRPKTGGRRQSITSLNDPLGFFGSVSTKDKEGSEIKDTPKPKRKGTTADWLGLVSEEKKETSSVQESIPQKEPQVFTVPDPVQTVQPIPTIPFTIPQPQIIQNQSAMLMATANLEAQNALQTLKQQESQVLMASQMKNQEEALLSMQKRQQELLSQQEFQFNDLLQKQISRQSQLEATIRSQQDRINAHIQLLMVQPNMTLPDPKPIMETKSSKQNEELENQVEEVHLKVEVKTLELEKLRLEDLVSNINANHDKEIEFMENSHKKQIKVLEDNLQSIETRLTDETKNLEEFFTKKITILETEKTELITNYENKLKQLKDEHEIFIKKLKSNHEADIEALRDEHKSMIMNIRQSKLLEFSVVQENSSYLQILRSASDHLENVSGDLHTIRDDINIKIDTIHKERDMKLEARERKIEDAERRLKITEESNEVEHKRLIELVTTLESQLTQLSRDSTEEQWSLRKKMSTLEAERISFEREKQFAREQIKREEKHIEELKQFQLDENQRLMQQIQDERQLLIMEKSKLETSKRLQKPTNIESQKTEIETALNVAQDAAKQADQERERYFGMQRQMEMKKRELIEQENVCRQKQDELESLICSTKIKEKQFQDSIQRNRSIEQNFNNKIHLIQFKIRQIGEREAHLSEERLELTKERVKLQDFRQKLEQNKCSLCRIGERSLEMTQFLTQENSNPIDFNQNLLNNETLTNYRVDNIIQNNIDNLFDKDVLEYLKKMDNMTPNPELDQNFYDYRNSNIPETGPSVPTKYF